MRLLPLTILMLAGSLIAGEPAPSYPLWDVADYAKRVNLPATKTLDLGNGVKLEVVLIPAGKFIMGTPEPTPVDEEGFHRRILTGQVSLAVSTLTLLVMLVVVVIKAVREKRRPQISLALLSLVTVTAGGAVLSSVHWRQLQRGFETAQSEYLAAQARLQSANDKEKPAHSVKLTKPYYMGKFAVTQEQYQAVVGTNPSSFNGKDNPVESVSWNDAQDFCKKLSELTHLAVRLPTEAEWEYGCRAGTRTTYYSGDTEKDLDRVAWYGVNSKSATHPVGQKQANAFGLYDMHGNVWQWCEDVYRKDYYEKSEAENPQGPAVQTTEKIVRRAMRGGGLGLDPMFCRSASRSRDSRAIPEIQSAEATARKSAEAGGQNNLGA